MTTDPKKLTIQQAQQNQPWVVPYSKGVRIASGETELLVDPQEAGAGVPHILGSHCVLHAIKSIGKIAAVYERRDHFDRIPSVHTNDGSERAAIRAAAADLVTAALRFANLEGFDLAEALVERVLEKNGADFGETP